MHTVIESTPADNRILPPKEAAAMLGVAETTLATWRSKKSYPLRYIKMGKLIRYRAADILDFLERCNRSGLPTRTAEQVR